MRRSIARAVGAGDVLFGLVVLLMSSLAAAHEMSMAEMNLHEVSKGQFALAWGQSGNNRPTDRLGSYCRVARRLL